MISTQQKQIEATLVDLYNDSKFDSLKMIKGATKSMFRPMQPSDFKDAYLSISKEQGEDITQIIKENNFKNIVEFGTSFGISTLFLAQGVLETKGHIITTELLESKAKKAIVNFKKANVNHLIEVRIGNALETLKNYDKQIDFLLLDGWKDLYFPLFQMLKSNFHSNIVIYVDNANMSESKTFLSAIAKNNKYCFQSIFGGKAIVITIKK